jgi:hypothetical protein
MSKLTLNTIGSRYGSIDALNANSDLIEAALENTISRDGTGPNNMEANLDMDSHRVINMADGAGNQDAATLKQVNSLISAASSGIIASLKERQDATAGQTVFTLASISYTTGSNNLAVYIDGVRQYAGESYVETNSTTVTFTAGLHLGAEVMFITNESVDTANVQASAVHYTPPYTGGVPTTVEAKLAQTLSLQDFGLTAENSPFGKTGLRLVAGESRGAHYAWASIVEIPSSSKWVMIYRKGTMHGTEDGAEVRAADSYDFGLSWTNDRQIQTDATTDSRPDKIAMMANGRIGFFCNRASAGSTNKYPLFIYSDNNGVTWTKTEVPTSSTTYTFSSVGGIISYPASQGGNNTTGFITFGYIDATGLDAFTTVNNGTTWSTVSNVTGSTVVSENVVVRIGTTDRWLCFVRNSTNVLVYKTTNLLSWGTAVDSGLESLSTPPGGFYDSVTDKVYYIGTARAGKEVNGYKNNILFVGEDADTLWTNGGVFTNDYKSLVTAPNWTTGYFYTFTSKLGLTAVFTAGENISNGLPPSSVWMLGNFEINGADLGMFVDKYTRNLYDVNFLALQAVDNDTATYPLVIKNSSKTVSNYFGAYTTSYNLGGATHNTSKNNGSYKVTYSSSAVNVEYEFSNTGTTRYNGENLLFGINTTAKINGLSASAHYRIASSTSPSIRSVSLGTSSARKHAIFHHDSGSTIGSAAEVGSISTNTTDTFYNTVSDETFKDFIGEYSGQDAIKIIKADPVREYHWKPEKGGKYGLGWGAQTSYKIADDLASKGGWFKDDVECSPDTEGATYVSWTIDKAKRTPYLWAAVSHLIDKLEKAEERIALLESKYK